MIAMKNMFLEKLTDRLIRIEEEYKCLSFLIKKRYTNEKLLQLEAMRMIFLMPDVIEYIPERPYDFKSKEKCDF